MGSDDPEDERFIIGDDAASVPSTPDVKAASSPEVGRSERGPCRLIAFAAGRGGAGKSLLAANVAVYLAQLGRRVVAVDADPAGGGLHRLLGAPRAARGYGDLLRGGVANAADVVASTPVAGLGLVAGSAHPFAAPLPVSPPTVPQALVAALRRLEVDDVVLDLGHPDSALCIDVWLAADQPIVVTLPDPASIDATYRFVKSGFLRRLQVGGGFDELLNDLHGPPPAALDLYRKALGRAEKDDPPSAQAVRVAQEMAAYRPRFVISQTRSLADLKLGVWMASAAQRRLGHALSYLGHVESDEAVWVAARRHRPLVAEYPDSKVAKNIEKIVRRLLSSENERAHHAPAPPRPDQDQTHYEILETEPGVSDEEIRRAFRRLKEVYAEGSPAIQGLYDDHELQELHTRADAAHDVLFAPERRRQYDLSLPEADLARAVRAAAKHGVPRVVDRHEPSEPIVEPEGDVTGAYLRKVREARGMDLGDVAQRTKISERHLRSIEDERFSDLPATVYVRGFVIQYARVLRIDPTRAAAHYLRRYHEAAASRPAT